MRTRTKRRKKASSGHDHGYKRLFSHSQAVEDLLRGFLPQDWVERLDLSTLERVGNGFISDDLRERQSDVIWRVRWKADKERWFYLYLLVEFQSTSYHFMAARLLTYIGLLIEEIIRKEKLKRGDKIPAILPIVIYNGKRPWLDPLDLSSLFVEAPASLQRYLPRLRYLVLDESRLDLDRPELSGNRVAALFRIETLGEPEDLPRLTQELAALLPRGQEPELRRTFTIWLRALLQRTFPGATISKTVDLEDAPMLEERLIEWREKTRREGRREGQQVGLRKGRKEGRAEGMRQVLLRLMERRFGPIPDEIRRNVEGITSPRRLNQLADRILTVQSLRDLGL
jgi:predicted transposase YdaD